MKKILLTIAVLTISNFANAVYLEVDGKPVPQIIINEGSSTLINENQNSLALITCGDFQGTVIGVNRIQNLAIGTSTIVSNNDKLTIVLCE